MKYHSVSVDQDGYATSIADKYLYTATVKASTEFYKTTLPSDMIFTRDTVSTSGEQVGKFTREFNIHYRAYTISLIYLLSTREYLSLSIHKLAQFSSNNGKVHF